MSIAAPVFDTDASDLPVTRPGMAGDWARAALALDLLAVDPAGLGGLHLRARPGPVRDAALARLAAVPLPLQKLHPAMGDEALFGGLDLAATLAAARMVRRAGLLSAPRLLVLTMAERCPAGMAARLAAHADGGSGALVLLDEGVEPEETAPAALTDRLAFALSLDGIGRQVIATAPPADAARLAAARDRLAHTTLSDDAATAIVTLAARLGIAGLRAPILALAAARAHAALAGRDMAAEDDIAAAAALVLLPRATQAPDASEEMEDDPPPEPEPEDPPDDTPRDSDDSDRPLDIPEELLVDAITAILPPELLAAMAGRMGRAGRTASGSGAGAKRQGNRRGRPLPSRPGRPDSGHRVDLVATLRAAAPWQRLRRDERPDAPGIVRVRAGDIRLKRFEDRSDRLLIFTVDASGSAAIARLAEAKGAVELLLADAYARRDHVALIAFRGTGAEELLPPTRSLVQTKRRLAGLPGGGGTPLAAGLRAGLEAALAGRGRGMSPTLALLTDGRANIALDGRADRAQAGADATTMAQALRARGVPAVVLDTAARPQPALRALAAAMDATYLPLPRADAGRLSRALGAAIRD
jgi:magnesium chelatase subunit D